MSSRTLFATGLLAFTSLSRGSPTGQSTSSSNTSIDAATEFALTYGFPLYPFRNSTISTAEDANGTNKFYHATQLADASFRQVVSPNVDTLYSSAVIDLSHHDLILEVPEIDDRYYVFALYDVWGDNYVNLGTTSKSTAGKYRIRYSPAATKQAGLQLCSSIDSKQNPSSICYGMQGIINAVTPYGSMQPRYAVITGDQEEIDKIGAYQNQSSLVPAQKSQKGSEDVPALTMAMLNSSISSDMATQVMQLTARIAPHNPPRNVTDKPRVNANLKAAGIQNGQYKPQKGQHLQSSFNKTKAQMVVAASTPLISMDMGHNWTSLRSSIQGDFGTNYPVRQYVATTGYLMLTQSEALYPTYPETNMSLTADEAYVFNFDSKPPLDKMGFWSLTAYNEDHFLIDNEKNVYSLGSHSNITYSDGSKVYGDSTHEDSSFQFLIQPENVAPPSNWTSNWIPAPTNGGAISLILRLYGPTDGVTDGSWKAPKVTKQKAITA